MKASIKFWIAIGEIFPHHFSPNYLSIFCCSIQYFRFCSSIYWFIFCFFFYFHLGATHSTRIHTHFPCEFPRRIVSECESMIHLAAKFIFILVETKNRRTHSRVAHKNRKFIDFLFCIASRTLAKVFNLCCVEGPKSTLPAMLCDDLAKT